MYWCFPYFYEQFTAKCLKHIQIQKYYKYYKFVEGEKLTVYSDCVGNLGGDEQNGKPPAPSSTIRMKRLHIWKPFPFLLDDKIKLLLSVQFFLIKIFHCLSFSIFVHLINFWKFNSFSVFFYNLYTHHWKCRKLFNWYFWISNNDDVISAILFGFIHFY